MTKSKSLTLPFLRRKKVAKNTYSFYFDRSKTNFDFLPGQYVRMTLPHINPDDRGTSRYFTIASSPLQKDILMLTVRIYDSSFKKALHDLRPGDVGSFFGPMGWFLLPKDEPFDKVFIAGGIGITPFHSLLHFFADKKLDNSLTLFASFPTREEVVFYDALDEINKKHKKINVIYTLTGEKNIPKEWMGEVGRISKQMLQKYIPDLHKPIFYVVGSPKMVAGVSKSLLKFGVPEEHIQTEDFTGY